MAGIFVPKRPRRRRVEDGSDRFSPYPPPSLRVFPKERTALTRPPSPKLGLESLIQPFTQSSIAILPFEIRRLIWRSALGGYTLHLDTKGEQLYAEECLKPDSTCYRGRNGCRLEALDEQPLRLLSVLLTCKQIYFEAIDYLYSANTFIISDSQIIEYLPVVLLPQRIAMLHTLRFRWDLADDPPLRPPLGVTASLADRYLRRQNKWRTVWHNIANMQNLCRLEVELNTVLYLWSSFNKESAQILLAPIKEVTAPKHFLLRLSFPAMENGARPVIRCHWSTMHGWHGPDPWDELPCTIERVHPYG